jgi:hypothetical protein
LSVLPLRLFSSTVANQNRLPLERPSSAAKKLKAKS